MKTKYFSVIFIFLTACVSSKKASVLAFAPNVVVAHRGAFKKNNFPENSIASLREAVRLQCTGSEFDVRMSKDDSLVINHDPHFQKMEIENTEYAELIKTLLPNGEKLPTLREYLLAGIKDNKLTRLVVEIKPSGISSERGLQVAEKVLKLVHELSAEKMVVYISFDYDIVKRIKQLEPGSIVQYLNGDRNPDQLKEDNIDGADYSLSVFKKNPEWISMAKKNHIILNAWTVNKQEDLEWVLANKFDFITTNEPELLLDLVKKNTK